jgi:hypothetical protein
MASNAAKVLLIASTGEVGGSTAWGTTGAAATRKLHGVEDFSVTATPTVEAVPTMGFYGPGPIADMVSEGAEFTINGTWTYQESLKFLNGFFTALSCASSSDATNEKYHYNAPVTSTQASFTWPLEFGQSTQFGYKVNGGVFNTLKLSGEAGSLWKFGVGGFGKFVMPMTTGMSTAALADARTVYPVAMKDTSIRIAAWDSATWGSSAGQLDGTLISFEFDMDTKRHAKTFAGSAFPGAWGDGRYEGTLRTMIEFTSGNVQPLLAEMLGTTGGAGSTAAALQRIVTIYASRDSSTLVQKLDFAGIVSEPVKLWDDRDGNMTLDLTWTGKFSTAIDAMGTSETGNWLHFMATATSCHATS